MTFHEFITMGGYAPYVWPAYGITLFVFGLNLLHSLKEKKRIKKYIQGYLIKNNYS